MMHSDVFLEVARDEDDLACIGSGLFRELAWAAIRKRSRFTVALSGGNTPRPLYRALAADRVSPPLPWDCVHFFWGDERNVAAKSPRSNFGMANDTLLGPLSIQTDNIHRIQTQLADPLLVAQNYEQNIRVFFDLKRPSDRPRFDLVLLGIGEDGHTASLFADGIPGTSIGLADPNFLVIAPWVPHLNEFRYSLTPSAINEAAHVVFIATGSKKAAVVSQMLRGSTEASTQDEVYPAQSIRPTNGRLVWIVDELAGQSIAGAEKFKRLQVPEPEQHRPKSAQLR